MSSARHEIELGARKRYETPRLYIVPSLAGAQHHIVMDGYRLRFELPERPRQKDWASEDAPIACYTYRQHTSGRRSPIMFSVNRVTCVLETTRTIKIPSNALGAVNITLFGAREKEKLYRWTDTYSATMDRAFSHWLSVLRWRSGLYNTGARYEKRDAVYDGTYLIDHRSGRRFFSEMTVIKIENEIAISVRQWKDVQAVLARNEPTPMWHILLAEAAHQLRRQDQRRFLVDLALACEIVLRNLMQVFLKQRVAIELTETMPITRIIDSLKHPDFRVERSGQLRLNIPEVKKIFEYRNKIMHRGWRPEISIANCRVLQNSAIKFVSEIEREIVRKSCVRELPSD